MRMGMYVSTRQGLIGNNPVNLIDPTGESWLHVAFACVAVVGVCALVIVAAPVVATAAAGVRIVSSAAAIASTAAALLQP